MDWSLDSVKKLYSMMVVLSLMLLSLLPVNVAARAHEDANAYSVATTLGAVANTKAHVAEEMKYYVKNFYYKEVPAGLDEMTTPEEISDALDPYSTYMTKQQFILYSAYLGASPVAQRIIKPLMAKSNPFNAVVSNTQTSDAAIPVTSKVIGNHTGYIKIKNFSNDILTKIEAQWAMLQNKGATSLIIDLRGNGGGYIDSAQQVISFFPTAQNAFYIEEKQGRKLQPLLPTEVKFPVETYILQNNESASASEMVAVSAKDQQLATIVGQKSFGKGTVQTFYRLSDEGVLRLTTGEFFGTAQTKVNRMGIEPDVRTASGHELTTAHKLIIENNYRPLQRQQTTAGMHELTINLPRTMNFIGAEASHTVDVVEIGGAVIPAEVEQMDFTNVTMTPTVALERGQTYYALIEPKHKRQNGKRRMHAYAVPITVK